MPLGVLLDNLYHFIFRKSGCETLVGAPPLGSNRGPGTGKTGGLYPTLVEVLSPEWRTCRRWILELLPKEVVQQGQGPHTLHKMHQGAPLGQPSHRLVERRDGLRIRAGVLCVLACMLGWGIADAGGMYN